MRSSTVIRSLILSAALAVSGCTSTQETVTTTTTPDRLTMHL